MSSRSVIRYLQLSVILGLVSGCATTLPPEIAFAPQPPPSFWMPDSEADPAAWGVYARLVGHKFAPPTTGFPGYEFKWSKPGQEIQEIIAYIHGELVLGDQERSRRVVRLGANGTLISTKDGKDWTGTIEPDGSVYFTRPNDWSYRMRLTTKGELRNEPIDVTPDGKLAAVYDAPAYPVFAGPALDAITTTTNSQPKVAVTSPIQKFRASEQLVHADSLVKPVASTLSDGASAPAMSASSWGVLEKIAGKTWQQKNSGGWMSHRVLLTYSWSADRQAIEMTGGDGYSTQRFGDYRVDPTTPGRLISNTADEDGDAIQVPASMDASGTLTVQLSKKRRSVTALDADGSLIQTQQKMTWGGDWEVTEAIRFVEATPGPEWGLFSQLVGYNWSMGDLYSSLNFVWLPEQKKIETRIGNVWDVGSILSFSTRPGHRQQLVASSVKSEDGYHFFGGAIGLVTIESDVRATSVFERNSYIYELSSRDRLIIYSKEWIKGELKTSKHEYRREDRAQKDYRLALINGRAEKLAAQESTVRSLRSQEALYSALTAAKVEALAQVAQSQDALDATLEQAARQQTPQRHQVFTGNGPRTNVGVEQADGTGTTSPLAEKPQPGSRPLRFYITGITDALARKCVSNIVSVPGPAGWPIGPNADQARALIEPYKQRFAAACGSGADGQGTQSISYQWNRESDGELDDALGRDLNPQQRAELVDINL